MKNDDMRDCLEKAFKVRHRKETKDLKREAIQAVIGQFIENILLVRLREERIDK